MKWFTLGDQGGALSLGDSSLATESRPAMSFPNTKGTCRVRAAVRCAEFRSPEPPDERRGVRIGPL